MAASIPLAACDTDRQPPEPVTVADSAGVSIIRISGVDGFEQVRLDTPSMSLGALNGAPEHEFHMIQGAVQLSDGRIAVLNTGSHEVRYFAADGTFAGSVGRSGRGPEEFGFPLGLHRLRGDSVVVWDLGNRRLTIVDPQPEIVHLIHPSDVLSGFSGLLDVDRAVIGEPQFPRVNGDRLLDGPMLVAIRHLAGREADTIGIFGNRKEMQTVQGGRNVRTPVPFTVNPVVRTHAGEIFMIDGTTPNVYVYDDLGALVRILRLDLPAVAVTRQSIQRFADFRDAAASRAGEDAAVAADLNLTSLPTPDTEPYFDRLLIGSDGRVWLQRFAMDPDAARTWIVVGADGQSGAVVTVPPDFVILDADESRIVGRATDELGVQSVRQYRIGGASEGL